MQKIKSAFCSFSTSDIKQAKQFYGETLGLDVEETEMGLSLKLPGVGAFIYEKDDHQPATHTILNFVVEDIEATVAELKNKGITFETYEAEMTETDENNIARGKKSGDGPDIAWFKDPAGNFLAVLEN